MPSVCNTAFTCFLAINSLAWNKMQTQGTAVAQDLWLTASAKSADLWLTASAKSADLWLTASNGAQDLWLTASNGATAYWQTASNGATAYWQTASNGATAYWQRASNGAQDFWINGTHDFWTNSVEPRLRVIDAQWAALGPENQDRINGAVWGLFLGLCFGLCFSLLFNALNWTLADTESDTHGYLIEAAWTKPLFPPSPVLRRSSRPSTAPKRFTPAVESKRSTPKRSTPKQQKQSNPAKPKGLSSMYLYHDIQTINGLDTRKGYYHKPTGYIQDTQSKAWTTLHTFGLNHFKDLVAAGLTTRKSYKWSINAPPSDGGLYALNRGHKKALSAVC